MNSQVRPRQELRWTPFLTLLEKEVRRFFKVVYQTVLSPLVSSSLYLLIFGVSLGRSIDLPNGLPYLLFIIPGLVMMGCLNNSYQNSSSSLITARVGGDLEDLKASPLTTQQILWALSLGGVIRGFTVGAITFLVGTIFYQIHRGEWIPVESPFWALFFLLVGALCFAKIGIAVAFWAKNFDQMSAVGSFVLLPLIYLGGVFFSVEILHPVWQIIASWNPLLYLINGFRYGLIGVSDVPVYGSAAVALVSLLIFHILAYRSISRGSFSRW